MYDNVEANDRLGTNCRALIGQSNHDYKSIQASNKFLQFTTMIQKLLCRNTCSVRSPYYGTDGRTDGRTDEQDPYYHLLGRPHNKQQYEGRFKSFELDVLDDPT